MLLEEADKGTKQEFSVFNTKDSVDSHYLSSSAHFTDAETHITELVNWGKMILLTGSLFPLYLQH